MHRLMAHKGHM